MSTRGHHRIRSKRKKKGSKKARDSHEREAEVDARDEEADLESEVSPSG